jgi:Zn finger protein HypA/HybF involved in hydrogenase expression
MISVAVKVETECGTCRMPMPVNTLAHEVGCPSCGRPMGVSGDLWQALLRDAIYEGPKMLQNEGRQAWVRKFSATYTRINPCCRGCEKEIPFASIVEVGDQAMLRCDRCAKQTWVRTVPAELAGALPNITHLVGEEPDPLVVTQATAAEAATFPCPQCGSPVPFDGVNRAYTCRFCSASAHVPDDFVYRGRRGIAANWFLCYHASITDDAPAAQAIDAGLFDWVDPPDAAVDADGNLYCAAVQSHWVPGEGVSAKEERDDVLWSIDPSLNVRWLLRGNPQAARLALSPKGTLLVSSQRKLSRPWLSSRTGMPIEGEDGTVQRLDGDLLDCMDLACDRDGSLLILKDDLLRRIAPSGAEMSLWPGGTALSARPVADMGGLLRFHCGADGSIYCMYGAEIVRVDATGRILYRVDIPTEGTNARYRVLGVDLEGCAYVICGGQLLRIDAAGERRIVLDAKRDDLPRPEMSIAVCPDGSHWLFGKKGRAWKFGPSGTLLFASGKENRPRKVTRDELLQQQRATSAAKAETELQEQLRLTRQRKVAEDKRTSTIAVVGAAVLIAIFVLWVVAMR